MSRLTESAAPVLRPLGIGDIVPRMITLYRGSPILFAALALLPYIVFALILGLVGGSIFVSMFAGFNTSRLIADPALLTPGQIGTLIVFGAIVAIVAIVVFSAQAAAIVDATAKRYLGAATTVGRSLGTGLRASARLVFAYILAAVILFVVCGLFIVVLILIGVAIRQTPALVALLTFVGGLALFVGLFYVLASLMVLPAVVTVEGAGPLAAIRRSWNLSNGYRWRILGLQLLMTVIAGVLSVLSSVVLLLGFTNQGTAQLVLQQVLNVLVNALWAPVQWGVFTILYYDLRVRKEAFDLQLAAEALPRDT